MMVERTAGRGLGLRDVREPLSHPAPSIVAHSSLSSGAAFYPSCVQVTKPVELPEHYYQLTIVLYILSSMVSPWTLQQPF